MHVVFHAIDAKQLATPALQDAPDVPKQLFAAGLRQRLATILRAKNDLI
jgi:hypothetical protein